MLVTGNEPLYTRRFWAKAQPYRQKGPERIHLLEHHLADVGACFEALLAQPTIRRRLARSGGLDTLDDGTAARLALFAALHDIGKVNVGFQTQVWLDEDFPAGRRRPGHAGHYHELAPVLRGEDGATADWFFDNLGWWHDATESWDDRDGETVCALFIAALSHHGQPLQLEGRLSSNSMLWDRYGNLVPEEAVRRIGELSRRWFPAAFSGNAQHLPSEPAFQHMFLGLCTLADWIGSDEDRFPYCGEPRDDYMETAARKQAREAVSAIGLDLEKQRAGLADGLPSFSDIFGFAPNAIQKAATGTPLHEPLVIIESETGSGKTEAALWRFVRMYEKGLVDGLYFALPTRAAATQLHGRLTRFVERMFLEGKGPEPVLAVPGYVKAGDIAGHHLQNYEVWWEDHADASIRNRRWAAESAKRYLAAQIAVGTVDQAMMAALKVKHAHMRAACLSRNLLVVDEVHASDAYMSRIIKALLDAHLGAGGYALLMSATLGSAARRQWLSTGRINVNDVPPLDEAINAPYPAVSVRAARGDSIAEAGENGQEKTVGITAEPIIHDFDQVAARALRAARAVAKVLVIRNTVNHAIETQQALEQAAREDRESLFSCNGNVTLHHSRFAPDDRCRLDIEVERRLGKGRYPGGIVVVGTQTLEQSMDIDADLLITDLCPVDVLLQRIGRLHRHTWHDRPAGYETPKCIVLTPPDEDLSPLLQRSGPNRTGLGPHGFVYQDLRVLEVTRRLIDRYPTWDIPRMNRLLVEGATHPEALEAIVQEMGDDWRVHTNNVMGGQLGEGLTAANAVIRRDKSFFTDNHDVLFGSDEERIRTRLGDEGIEVKFDPQPPSLFDHSRSIENMTIIGHLLRGVQHDGNSVSPTMTEVGFTFAIGDRQFRYDRLGLRREG